MIARRFCLTAIALVAGAACHHASKSDADELALAAAASDSLTRAVADSIGELQGYVVAQQGTALSACGDHLDASGWQSVTSRIVDMELPPGFSEGSRSDMYATWTGPAGSLRVSQHRGSNHGWWGDKVTSECDIYISGSPAHVDLVTTESARSVYATITIQDAPSIELEGQARTVEGQAELLHSIRTARVSAAWGRKP
jgi:hypothetical protein